VEDLRLTPVSGARTSDRRLYALHCQALFGNLGSHKLAPAVEARAEFLTAAVGEDGATQLAQVRTPHTAPCQLHDIVRPHALGIARGCW